MTTVRSGRPPRAVTTAWAASTLLGAMLTLPGFAGPGATRPPLSPATLVMELQRALGGEARDVRINAFYGSGHRGDWQVTAHVTWRTPTGDIAGGTVLLPSMGSEMVGASTFTAGRLAEEHLRAWTLQQTQRALSHVGVGRAALAFIELQTPNDGPGLLTACLSQRGPRAVCDGYNQGGRRVGRGSAVLVDLPAAGALAVRLRRS